MQNPRKPSRKEKRQLAVWIGVEIAGRRVKQYRDLIHHLIEASAIAVFDDYFIDRPRYRGKLMTMVWSGAPRADAFIWKNGEMLCVEL